MAVQDILLTDTYDLAIQNGDFVVGESDKQHLMLIMKYALGALKKYPLQGVGIDQYSGSSGQGQTIVRNSKVKIEADGYSSITIDLEQGADGVFIYDVNAIRT